MSGVAQVIKRKFLSLQVCVPVEYTDEQAVAVAEADSPCGTTNGWQVRQELGRVPCESHAGFVHLVVDA